MSISALAPHQLFLCAAAPFVGSFLGVVAIRLPKGEGWIGGRSVCPACGHKLAARDLVPIVSWLWQQGRCSYCTAAVSTFYPFMEIGALLVALSAVPVSSGWLLWASCGFGWILLTLAATDCLYLILPDELVLPLIPAGIAVSYFLGTGGTIWHVAGACVGFAAFWLLNRLYRALRGYDGLGGGDAKLLAASGAWVSLTGLPLVILLSATFGLLAVLAAMAMGRKISATDKIPFGSFLCLGTWLVWLLGLLDLLPGAPGFA
jgi:leader peptidase (prepilin peptidase)/N-methyltransferase